MATETKERATTRRRATAPRGRRERLEARISPEQKQLLQRAAAIRGGTLTDFILASAREAAERTIREHDVMTLSVRDSEHFAGLALDPPEPGERLRAAAQRYTDIMGG